MGCAVHGKVAMERCADSAAAACGIRLRGGLERRGDDATDMAEPLLQGRSAGDGYLVAADVEDGMNAAAGWPAGGSGSGAVAGRR